MAHEGNPQNRTSSHTWTNRACEPALTWPVAGARQAWGVARPHAEFLLSTKIRKWAAEEVVGGRLFPWFAVAYGFGIVLYFTAEREPAGWAAIAFAIGCSRPPLSLCAGTTLGSWWRLACAAMAAGFAARQ